MLLGAVIGGAIMLLFRNVPVADPAGGDYRADNPRNVAVSSPLKVTFNAHGGTSRQYSTTLGGAFVMTVHETGFVEVSP